MKKTKSYADLIKTKKDFPIPGISFFDIHEIFQNPKAFDEVLNDLTEVVKEFKPDGIISTEARGWIFASTIANRLNLPFIMIRKAGKLPYPTGKVTCKYEYAKTDLEISLTKKFNNLCFVDDILATGETLKSSIKLTELSDSKITSVACLARLTKFSNLHNIKNIKIVNLLSL